jgi:rubrerythrin
MNPRKEPKSSVESQAKKVVENALGQLRGHNVPCEYAQQIIKATSAAMIYNIIQNFRHEDRLNYPKVATALDDLEKKLENHNIGTHAFVEQAHTIIHKSGLLPHA